MSVFKSVGQFLSGPRLSVILAGVLCFVLLIGYLLFYQFRIAPQTRAADDLASKLVGLQRQVGDAGVAQAAGPDKFKTLIATAQVALNESSNVFFSPEQEKQVLDRLYERAAESGVQILDLQAQPTPAPEAATAAPTAKAQPSNVPAPTTAATAKAAATSQPTTTLAPPKPTVAPTVKVPVEAKAFKVQVQGTLPGLVNFMARLKEAQFKTFIIGNVNVPEGTEPHNLTMIVTLYASSLSQGIAGFQEIAGVPLARVTAALTSASATPGTLLVRPTNWPTTLPWPPTTPSSATPQAGALPTPSVTLAPANPTPGAQYFLYVVRKGDTLYSIARRYKTTVEAIMTANGLVTYAIKVGQTLRIPQ